MKTFRQVFIAAVIFLLQNVRLNAQRIDYKRIPDGFDFPAPEATLLDALKAGDEAKLRTHAWMVFAGLTQPARPEDPTSEALWETWYRGDEVFSAGAAPQGERMLRRNLIVPRQFAPPAKGPQPQAVGVSELANTLFNKELKDHTRQNQFYLASTLNAINSRWTPQTPVANRKIKDYPREAMSLKMVWRRLAKRGLTPLPIWDEQPRTTDAPRQPPPWHRTVLVDPSRDAIPVGEMKDGSHVVPLSAFYHFALPEEQGGDFMVLVAMHYTTKEIPNWVWATFWWHDKPNDGPYSKNRPADTLVKGLWRHFLMDVSYDMNEPKESDQTPNAVFNPWLEARFPNGVNSNCMTCHQRAVWPEGPVSTVLPPQERVPWLPITRGAAAASDRLFKDRTKLDFLWSLLLEGGQ